MRCICGRLQYIVSCASVTLLSVSDVHCSTEVTLRPGGSEVITFTGGGSDCFHFTVTTDRSIVGVFFQVHTLSRKVSLSKTLQFSYETTTNGTHVGLFDLTVGKSHLDYYAIFECSSTNQTARALVIAQPVKIHGEYLYVM